MENKSPHGNGAYDVNESSKCPFLGGRLDHGAVEVQETETGGQIS
jgi:hypothetical protein